ncbi:thioredoxin domain-containing protein [Flavitalea sp. BT771]|uniref:thioredoxin domain-containing protein n=1 Tax=Flavitalea sp. BT771 TaxID=3063329 RepID=UPI0026E1478F|nr:thioredoxin domain-containing protein [Flavitalea sp. BT771]MDO6434077.1 thioredoxin domain-containing protein [Flavitalea sp. BT771]MDV6222977.1 thioredoxin domain-containing protein [Flavitalea sp. BT771]
MNRLSQETSPYLLQHAHNPVDWYPWGDEALQKARTENKPILVSIGYAACHWCHVMERESFEDEETAGFMNRHFINIKIDREERPDLDHIYMEAVQAITGSGGWPLNVFLTPEGKPFYGGTYFPPRAIYNRPSWRDVLKAITDSFREKRQEIEQQAQQLTDHVATTGSFGVGGGAPLPGGGVFHKDTLRQVYESLMGMADKQDGGFGRAPKFPQTFSIQFLLHYYYFTKEAAALEQACLSLEKMIRGGIYDQLGGGFARYSTDGNWLVPHFEKMLYDNALLVIVLSEAYQLTHKEVYRDTIRQTMDFVRRELSDGAGAFYSALDADSEGEEGRFYVWDKTEIDAVLGEEAPVFNQFYGVTAEGNWEGRNILIRPGDLVSHDPRIESARIRLLAHRGQRVRPALDDKILLGWNALMNIACCKAYGALGDEQYREWAVENMDFIYRHLKGKDLYFFYHSYKAGQAKFPAFLDDYAGLMAALLQLQEITGDAGYLIKAKEIMEFTLHHFSDEDTDLFFFTHKDQQDLIVRKKEIYDGATPSGNGLMAFNLAYMGIIFNEGAWRERAVRMAAGLHRPVTQYPGSFGIWATLYQALTYIIPEIVLTGRHPEEARSALLQQFIPYRVFQSANVINTQFPLLSDKSVEDFPLMFLCKNYTCQLPVNEVAAFIRLLENV